MVSYTGSAILIFYTVWLMLENSPTRGVIKWFPERKRSIEVSMWTQEMPQEITWDVPARNSTTIAWVSELRFLFVPHTVYMMWHASFTGADLPTLLHCWPAFISALTLLTLASIWQLNTLHHSATFTLRTDMELIAAFLFPIFEVTSSCPRLNPERFFYR